MKERFKKLLEKKRFHYLCIFLISLLVAIPLINLKVCHTHDGNLHILRLIGTKLSMHYTEFPHLIIPFFCSNFGYSINAFYAPLTTYASYFIAQLPILCAEALKLFAYLTILLSGITMYHCAYEITKRRKVALVASFVYMLAPYRSEDIYTRFAMAEFATFVFIPIIFQGLHNLLEGDKTKHWYLTVGGAALVLTHTITTLYIGLFCLFYVIGYWKKENQKEVLKKLIWNIFFVLGITAFFWVVLLEFRMFTKYIFFDQELMRTKLEYVEDETIEWEDFVKNDTNEDKTKLSYRLGIFTILLFAVSVVAIKKQRKEKFYVIFVGFALMSLFLCTKDFPWKEMPKLLGQIQYPWRMLGEFVFFSSIVIAKNCEWIWQILKGKKIGKVGFLMICIILLANQVYNGLERYAAAQRNELEDDRAYEDFISQHLNFSIFYINRDYLPYKAILHRDEFETKEDSVSVLEGQARITENEKDGTNLSCKLKDVKKETKLEIPYFYYPGYVVTLKSEEEEKILKQEESEYGMITVTLPENMETAEITVKYQGTTLEKASYIFSFASYLLFLVCIIRERRKEKNEEKSHEK